MGFIFGFFFAFIFATAGLFFSLMAFTQKNTVFFYLGIVFIVLTTLGLISNYEYIIYALQNGFLLVLAIIAAWIAALVFLILSRANPKKSDDAITDSFLDDIINAEDEEWDAES